MFDGKLMPRYKMDWKVNYFIGVKESYIAAWDIYQLIIVYYRNFIACMSKPNEKIDPIPREKFGLVLWYIFSRLARENERCLGNECKTLNIVNK